MKKISKNELLAILAAAGVSSTGAAFSAEPLSNDKDLSPLAKSEQLRPAYLADESKCGKGSCGKDEMGASAAKEKHSKAKKESKSKTKKKSDKG